ncbi:MAG: HAMP domain-containing protein [Clostridia bacterium]|nr:HAMP domain-containing protein [Clostridia bacterium]
MFKSSVQWKVVTMFVLIVIAIMMVFGISIKEQISSFYLNSFTEEISLAFSDELTNQLEIASSSENPVKNLEDILNTYSGRLGINSNRSYYILNRKTGKTYSSDSNVTDIEKTNNIISAMAGNIGNEVYADADFMDYAYPVKDYIIYIRDSKTEIINITQTMLVNVSQALFIGILFAIILGFIMSRTITRPIINMTKKAEAIAKGRFDTKIDVRSRDEIGKLAKTFNYMTSVIKSSMDEIDQEKIKLETVLRNMNDGVIAFDAHQHIMFINPEAKTMLDISDSEVKDIVFDDYFKQFDVEICLAEMLYLDHYETISKDLAVNGKYFKAFFASFKVDDEKSDGVVVVIQDITESQRLELSRKEFVANVSHELRTPLTTIKTYAETLSDGAKNSDEQKFLGVIIREVDRMTRIVKELLSLSSLDNGKLPIMKTAFSLENLVSDIVTKMKFQAEDSNLTLTYTSVVPIPPIYADIDRIEQVITNIISNSIKYTAEGGKIEVFTGYLYNEAYIKIKDNGIGIPKKDLPRIFERFYRVDKARSREKGGTGLGLAIASEIVELHGGTIKINSVYHEGTEVIIKLPVIEKPKKTKSKTDKQRNS